MSKIKELDVVEILIDLPEDGITKGERGTVVVVHMQPTAVYDLEFVGHFDDDSRFAYGIKPEQIKVI